MNAADPSIGLGSTCPQSTFLIAPSGAKTFICGRHRVDNFFLRFQRDYHSLLASHIIDKTGNEVSRCIMSTFALNLYTVPEHDTRSKKIFLCCEARHAQL